ncbi:hypothetical protein HWV62_20862 [Athelia sp. TMB]|nr:hypothetical protein HWV62_20862 [Athelia sp. TMB]
MQPINWQTMLYVNFTQAWYTLPILFLLLNWSDSAAFDVVSSMGHYVCKVPGISSMPFCAASVSYNNERSMTNPGNPALVHKTEITSLEDILVQSFLSKGLTSADISIGDAVFMVESSQMESHEDIVLAFDRLKEESVDITKGLLGLRAQTSHHTTIVQRAVDQLLRLITPMEAEKLSTPWFCVIPFSSCPADTRDLEHGLEYIMETLNATVPTLFHLADSLERSLRGLDEHLNTIRRLVAAESASVIRARNEILADPLYKLGFRRSHIILQHYESRLQASAKVLAFHRYATDHVTDARGRLSAVQEELKVLDQLAHQNDMPESMMRLCSFIEALRDAIHRLQSVQYALSGGYVGVAGTRAQQPTVAQQTSQPSNASILTIDG